MEKVWDLLGSRECRHTHAHTCTYAMCTQIHAYRHAQTCKYVSISTALKMKEVTVFSPDQLTREKHIPNW